MFDIGWSELLILAIVALIVIGPKELPEVLRTLGRAMNRMRRSADDFRRQFEDSVRDTGYDDIQRNLQDIRQFNPANQVRDSIDRALNSDASVPPAAQTASPPPAPDVPHQGVARTDHAKLAGEAQIASALAEPMPAHGSPAHFQMSPAAPISAEAAANDASLPDAQVGEHNAVSPVGGHHAHAVQEPAKAS